MTKRIFAVLLAMFILCTSAMTGLCAGEQEEFALKVKNINYDVENGVLELTVANTSVVDIPSFLISATSSDKNVMINDVVQQAIGETPVTEEVLGTLVQQTGFSSIGAGEEEKVKIAAQISNYNEDAKPIIDVVLAYVLMPDGIDLASMGQTKIKTNTQKDIFNTKTSAMDAVKNFLNQTGFAMIADGFMDGGWKILVMILISLVLMYLAIVKQFEPLLLLPIAFGMLLTNLPGAEMFHEELFAEGHAHWNLFGATNAVTPGLIDYLYLGVKLGIYPCLIFLGVGAMTDFGPLISNPKSLLLGAAAQLGIFMTYVAATSLFGFTPTEAASTGIIGGADGPTAIFVTTRLAPHLLGPIAVAAYSYMALVPVIQPPIMKLLTTKKERQIVMKPLREVSKTEKIIFPIAITIFVTLLVPSAGPLVGALMLGNLARECGVVDRISKTAQNELMNIVTIFLGISVGATATAETFLKFQTIAIIVMGVVAFGCGTAGGVLLAKFMNLFTKNKINPLIGSAGVSAVPMAARVSQTVGQKENPKNFLLMHAMGPNVAGVIGSAIAAGVLIALFG